MQYLLWGVGENFRNIGLDIAENLPIDCDHIVRLLHVRRATCYCLQDVVIKTTSKKETRQVRPQRYSVN